MTQSISDSTTVQLGTGTGDSGEPSLVSNDVSSAQMEEVLLGKLLEASSYERSGDVRRAAAIYHEIVAADAGGTWGQSAQKALETIESQNNNSDANGAISTEVRRDHVSHSSDSGSPSHLINEANSTAVAAPEIQFQTPNNLQTHTSNPGGRSVRRGAASHRLLSLRWAVVGAAAFPIAAVLIAALWWLPQRFEQRLIEGSTSGQETVISSSEVKLLFEQQRRVSLLVGLLALSVTLLVSGNVMGSLIRQLHFLAQQINRRLQGSPPDESGLNLLCAAEHEVGELARAIQHLGNYSTQCEQKLADAEYSKRIDLESATRETQRLQQQVIELLVQIEEVRSGNLTARAPMIDGKVGSIADAFNATIDSLRYIVAQVVEVTQSLTEGARSGEASVRQVSDSALKQSQTLKSAREDVAAMVVSIEQVSELAQSSAQVARTAIEAAHDGDLAMDRTVVSMEKIRTAVSNTSKRAKRLAESAQEVSQILAIVTGISEQANLLAFNASIEAARAGEQGQGFRQVSDEVRNLAAQVSEAAQDIERLVQSIQEETASVINVLEIGTSEVVNGTQLVHQTQKTLSHLTTLSQEIDTALQRVAANTTTQAETSQQVNQTMKSVAGVSLENAEAAREVVEVLQQLLREVSTLQASVNRFQV